MKKLLLVLLFILFASTVMAQSQAEYFYGIGCPHCTNVADSGVLDNINKSGKVDLIKHEVYYDVKGQERFKEIQKILGITSTGVPFLFINYSENYTYLAGDTPIIQNAEYYLYTGDFTPTKQEPSAIVQNLTLGAIIISALIDSINPCAFGVLIFLMISLLKTGSSKRALRYGIIYSAVVFAIYFLAGFGIFKAIQALTFLRGWIYIIAAAIVFIFALLEFIDFANAGKSDKKSILKIPLSAKPILEDTAQKGTLFAIISLGVLVSLFELPCTGGIYLGILSLMAAQQTFAWGYLFIYNLIFILPLIVITLLVYKGTSPEILQRWTNTEKRWMKFAAAIILVLLGIYLLRSGL
jgi:cytochrome c biogenesis protein CcdA